MTSAFISPKTFSINLSSTSSSPSSSSSSPNYYQQQPLSCRCKYQLSGVDERNFVLHDALDASGIDTTHARVLRHRLGSVSMLSIIYSEILKVLRIWGVVDFDVEIFFPRDSHSCPKGYQKQKSTESDQLHVMTTQSLLVEMLKDLKNAFWPFQVDRPRSPFLRAAQAAQCLIGQNNNKESLFELASAKAARHRLQRGAGAWTISRFGDIRRALAACERLILLKTDPKELRDYAVLLYHCGFYEESLHFLKLYQHTKPQYSGSSDDDVEEEAVEKLIIRLNLIVMEEGWSRPHDS
ncbi:uncharacterized protein LOC127264124 isoform X6 [Andrographis paniculata]|uniref:uncharacterized protein LOC127264124 isoform X6 n=1 Tax=Andrographis paniculata TaxID=175694 RepID=UPI0021E7551B|nr:uncharacterized protein LOC127264124 isoform X6 [Andrographis paniculata]